MSNMRILHMAMELWGCLFCMIAILYLYVSKAFGTKQSRCLLEIEITDILLLVSDAGSWFFRGMSGDIAFYGVRISNCCTFIMTAVILALFVRYFEIVLESQRDSFKQWAFRIIYEFCIIDIVLVIISQFVDLYYYFDEHNVYHRGKLFWLSQIWGIAGVLIIALLLIRFKKILKRKEKMVLWSYIIFPAIAMIIQCFFYGIALLNIAVSLSVIVMFITVLIEQSEQRLLEEKKIQELQTQIMISQIGSHFLFNTLSSIQYLCLTDNEKAFGALQKFSRYLRGNLENLTNNKCIHFEQELKHTQTYLDLEKIRYNDRLEMEYDIEEMDFDIPALTLQPMVENSIRHGIAPKREGGTIKIISKKTENAYEIRVIDNGKGFLPENVRDDGKVHIGIENVKTRLRDMCSGNLEIYSIPGQGTTVIISIPVNKKDKNLSIKCSS